MGLGEPVFFVCLFLATLVILMSGQVQEPASSWLCNSFTYIMRNWLLVYIEDVEMSREELPVLLC